MTETQSEKEAQFWIAYGRIMAREKKPSAEVLTYQRPFEPIQFPRIRMSA